MNTTNIHDVDSASNATHGLSIYGQSDAMDDFPVLKAFQQYIDSEQSKAHRRMVLLCIFFAILMGVVIIVFTGLLISIGRRNDTLNDRMMEYMLRERTAVQPTTVTVPVAPPMASQPVQPLAGNAAESEALKSMSDAILELKRQIADQQNKLSQRESQAKADAEAAALSLQQSDSARLEAERKAAEESARLQKERESLQAAREEIAREKERLREKEIDLQRRKLYPECYGPDGKLLPPKDRTEAPAKSPAPAAPVAIQDAPSLSRAKAEEEAADAEIARLIAESRRLEAEEAEAKKKAEAKRKAEEKKKADEKKKSDEKAKPVERGEAKPSAPIMRADGTIRYFEDDEELDEMLNSLPPVKDDTESEPPAPAESTNASEPKTEVTGSAPAPVFDWEFPTE